jgi:hypothetical protein
MKDKILLMIAYLISSKPYIYILIIITLLCFIVFSLTNYLTNRNISILKLDENKTKLIQIKEKELKPLEDKAKKLTQEFNTVKLEIIPIE